ncbi:MAG: hypothetical protein WCO08_02345 [Actinomycetes bacterium]
MRTRSTISKIVITMATVALIGSSTVFASGAHAATPSCTSITKAVVVADGYTAATGPKLTAYNYVKTSANEANALGTTIDFGAKALVVGCVSPADIAKLSKAAGKPTMTASAYLSYMAAQSAGAMKKTPVGGVSDYLDFGNGKEDGIGSTSKAGSLRLDAWVAGKFIILTFSAPATSPAPKPLLAFIKSTQILL